MNINEKIEQLKLIALFSFASIHFPNVRKIGSQFLCDKISNKNACKVYVVDTEDIGEGKKIKYIKWRDRYTVLFEPKKTYFYYLWYDNDRTAERLMLESMRVADMILKTSGIEITPSADFERYRCYVMDIYDGVKEGLTCEKK